MVRTRALARWLLAPCLSALAAAAFGATAVDFDATYARAEAAAKQAHALKNEWIAVKDQRKWTTAQGLQLAQTQAGDGKYGEAIKTAREVEALARGEISQAQQQAREWPQAAIR